MRYAKTTGLAAGAFVLACFLLAHAPRASACSCTGPRGKAGLEAAHAVFRGVAVEVEYLDPDTDKSEPRIVVTFAVSRVWKGPLRKEILLHTIYNKYSCAGFYFEKGKEYLVFAYLNDQQTSRRYGPAKETLGTNICGGTNLIESAEEDLRELGEGRRPE